MKVSLRVPSTFGSALTEGSEMTVEVRLKTHELVRVRPDEKVVREEAVPGKLGDHSHSQPVTVIRARKTRPG